MKQPVKIISIGAAVQDVFLLGNIFRPQREEDGDMVEEFELGSKNDVDDVVYSTGGGATNAAVTFARQGLHSICFGHIGNDIAGQAVMDGLHKEGVDTSIVKYEKDQGTGYSTLLLAPNGERTILTYRGASTEFKMRETDFHDMTADWIYVSSLGGNIGALHTIVNYARAHNIKIAANPGKAELKQKAEIKKILPELSILSLNKEELQMIFQGRTLEELVVAASKIVPCVIGTDGPKGSIATYEGKIFTAGMYEDVKVVDRTGAGDAFSSGFVAGAVKGFSVEEAMTLASANSTSVVQHVGAKPGILKSSAKLHAMPITSNSL